MKTPITDKLVKDLNLLEGSVEVQTLRQMEKENICLKMECIKVRDLNALFNRRDGDENMMRRARSAAALFFDNMKDI